MVRASRVFGMVIPRHRVSEACLRTFNPQTMLLLWNLTWAPQMEASRATKTCSISEASEKLRTWSETANTRVLCSGKSKAGDAACCTKIQRELKDRHRLELLSPPATASSVKSQRDWVGVRWGIGVRCSTLRAGRCCLGCATEPAILW